MSRRLPIVVLVVALVVGGLVLDRADDDTVEAAEPVATDVSFPVAAPPSSLSSTWFCAGGSADDEGFADHTVVVANPEDQPVEAVLTVFAGMVAPPGPSRGDDTSTTTTTTEADETTTTTAPPATSEPVESVVEVGPHASVRIRLADVVDAPVASALVEVDAGGVVVEHEIRSIHGFDAKPCATQAATTWHFAWGNTTVVARELLVLFNPFPDDAVVDGRFSTESGSREPGRLDGFVVPARSTVAIDLGDDVTRRTEVAGTLTVRSGRVVADRILRLSGENGGPRGLTVQTGIADPQVTWIYPDGFISDDIAEAYVVYNPSDRAAEVSIEITVDDPETNGVVEPFVLTVPPGEHEVVNLKADGRIPVDVGHAAVVRSENGVPVVAERVVANQGSARRGVSVSTGSPLVATTWATASGSTEPGVVDQWLVMLNLDAQVIAEIDVFWVAGGRLTPIEGLQGYQIQAGQRVAIQLTELINQAELPLLIRSSEPIAVERGMYLAGDDAVGTSNSPAVPFTDGLALPPDPFDAVVDADLGDVPSDDGDVPEAPDDVELPEPDATIPVDDLDPDATADDPGTTTTG